MIFIHYHPRRAENQNISLQYLLVKPQYDIPSYRPKSEVQKYHISDHRTRFSVQIMRGHQYTQYSNTLSNFSSVCFWYSSCFYFIQLKQLILYFISASASHSSSVMMIVLISPPYITACLLLSHIVSYISSLLIFFSLAQPVRYEIRFSNSG